MRTVYHPTLPTTYEVADSAAEEWQKAGWLVTPPASDSGPTVEETALATPARPRRARAKKATASKKPETD